MGAVSQPWLLHGNFLKTLQLGARESAQCARQQPSVSLRELVDFVGRNPMPSLRTKSLSTKVTDEEYARMEALAGDQTISEWARDVLLKAAKPNAREQVVLAEVVALRTILLNALFKLAQKEELSPETMEELIERADRQRFHRAKERLAAPVTGGQP
jgi:hypothetical protein